MADTTVKTRPLAKIATEIREDWKNPYFGAQPYIEAMGRLDKITDKYGMDTGEGIVRHFLSNAGRWRGPVAKKVKGELKAMLGN